MPIRYELFETVDLEQMAIKRLRTFEPAEGYIVCNSYGKDSCTIEHLCNKAGVKYESHHSHTGLDAPELIYFGRSQFPISVLFIIAVGVAIYTLYYFWTRGIL